MSSPIEIKHVSQHSHDSGAFLDWTCEQTKSEFITVVTVEGNKDGDEPILHHKEDLNTESFVTVLSIGDEQTSELGSEVMSADEILSCHLSTTSSDESTSFSGEETQTANNNIIVGEEVLVYRLPGERLGFGLKFEGGTKTHEFVRRLFIQSCAEDSPASRTTCSWGSLGEGDEIIEIDGNCVNEMTRLDCVRILKESQVVIKLRIVHLGMGRPQVISEIMKASSSPPPIPPRKRSMSPPVPKKRQQPPQDPPQAEVFLDLLAQEQDELSARISNCESESDDTGSSISTVICTTETGGGVDISKVLTPFEQLERELQNEFLALDEAIMMQPPDTFQDQQHIIPQPTPRSNILKAKKRRPPPPPPPEAPPPVPPDHLIIPSKGIILTPPSSPDDIDDEKNNNNTSWEHLLKREELCREILRPIPEEPIMVDDTEPTIIVADEEEEEVVVVQEEVKDTLSGPCNEEQQHDVSLVSTHVDKMNDVDESPPPSFSRLPPDGHEFPPTYVEPLIEAPLVIRRKQQLNDKDKSEKSVKDKIALFSNEKSSLARFRSTEDVSEKQQHSLQNGTTQFCTLPRTISHVRSQSLLDISSPTTTTHQRPISALLEQRRKSMSKLRGLVIPEKVESVVAPSMVDLPEIRSRPLMEKQPMIKSRSFDIQQTTISVNVQQPLPALPILPKYSPAFKRKSLSVLPKSDSVNAEVVQQTNYVLNGSVVNETPEFPVIVSETKIIPEFETKINNRLIQLEEEPTYKTIETKIKQSYVESEPKIKSEEFITLEAENRNSPEEDNSDNEKRFLKAQSVEAENRKNVLASARSSSGRVSLIQRNSNEELQQKQQQPQHTQTNIKVAYIEEVVDCVSKPTVKEVPPPPAPPRTLPPAPQPRSLDTVVFSTQPRSLPPEPKPRSPSPGLLDQIVEIPAKSPPAIKKSPPQLPVTPPPIKSATLDLPQAPPPIKSKPPELPDTPPPPVTLSTLSVLETVIENPNPKPRKSEPLVPTTRTVLKQSHVEIHLKPVKETPPPPPAPSPSPRPKPPRNYPPSTPEKHKIQREEIKSSSTKYTKDYKSHIPVLQESPISRYNNKQPQPSFRDIAEKWQNMADQQNANNRRSNSVTDIRKAFESPNNSSYNNNGNVGSVISHTRVCSLDSSGNPEAIKTLDAIGSMSSLASTTSLISQQELQNLLDDVAEEGANAELQVVILHREVLETSSVGLTLAGGADCENRDITVHKVLAGSVAEKDGRLQKADRVHSINGKSMKGLTHKQALAILKAPRPEVVLVVSRSNCINIEVDINSPIKNINNISSPIVSDSTTDATLITIEKDGTGLGFSLEGGKDSPLGDRPLAVKKIFTGGAAEKSGNLKVGDQLLAVNDLDVTSMSRIEAWNLMKKLPVGMVNILIRRPQ